MKQFFVLLLSASAFGAGTTVANAETKEISPSQQNEDIVNNELELRPVKDCRPNSEQLSCRLTATDRIISDSLQTIVDIQVRFVDREGNSTDSNTNPKIITREFNLQPGDAYDPGLVEEGLERVNNLVTVKQASLNLSSPNTPDEVVMTIDVEENNRFFFSFGSTLQPPTALQGSARPVTVPAMSNGANGIAGGVRFGVLNLAGDNQALTLGVEGGENRLGLDLDYRHFLKSDTGYGVNFFHRQSVEPEFDEGDRDVDLASGDDPWVYRIGGGVEYFRPLGTDFDAALGVTYQKVSVRDGLFSDEIASEDELGNSLTFSDDGQDDLLTLNFAAVLDRRNDKRNATKGYKLLLSTDQSIPVGDASILSNRLAANYTLYLPLSLFGFAEEPRTLVLNLQGGTIIGDLPPYEAFSLGGSNSVRGYGGGEVGTGRSFIQATTEYRFPLFSVDAFKEQWDIGGALFIDYASDLGTGDNVTGEPAVVRDKPGDGLGYGLGLRTLTPVGIVNLDFALNDEGDSAVIFKIGDRF